ncbi:MAG: hypothetical protein LBU67_01990 [Oscillospiraceae bacterium]|nr:hypothetical protein [Oscillospiraceae bacterium]
MKKFILMILLASVALSLLLPLEAFALSENKSYGGVTSNNRVDTKSNGEWSSTGGTYIKRTTTSGVVKRWGLAAIACEKIKEKDGNTRYDNCASVAAYLYTREDANRVTAVAGVNVCAAHNMTPDLTRGNEYLSSSVCVGGRTYKTVGRTNSGGNIIGPNRIFFHTVP